MSLRQRAANILPSETGISIAKLLGISRPPRFELTEDWRADIRGTFCPYSEAGYGVQQAYVAWKGEKKNEVWSLFSSLEGAVWSAVSCPQVVSPESASFGSEDLKMGGWGEGEGLSFPDLFVCAPGKKRLRWADSSGTHLNLSLAAELGPPELHCEQAAAPAKEEECSEIIFFEKKKKGDKIFDSDTRVSSPRPLFFTLSPTNAHGGGEKASEWRICKENFPKCLCWQSCFKGPISHLFSDFSFFFSPLRHRHEMPRTINHPKTLKMFSRNISEHVLKTMLCWASHVIWMRTETRVGPTRLRICCWLQLSNIFAID